MYLTFEQYVEQYPDTDIEAENFESLEKRAETDINGLTFNRISAKGFAALTDFQKLLVRRATAMQVKFINENFELLDSPLSGYSISGVSMSFDKSKTVNVGGVTTSNNVYNVLMQTGLMYRGLG